MLITFEGKKIKANGFRHIGQVKAQFVKAGHVPGKLEDLIDRQKMMGDGEENSFYWICECGAKLIFTKKGNQFNRLRVSEPTPDFLKFR